MGAGVVVKGMALGSKSAIEKAGLIWHNTARVVTSAALVALVGCGGSGGLDGGTVSPPGGSLAPMGWGEVQRLPGSAASDVVVGIDRSGAALAVWRQADALPASNASLWSSRYTPDSGWSTPQRLEDLDQADVLAARVSVEPLSGRALVTWIQRSSPLDTNFNGTDLWARMFEPTTGWGISQRVETLSGDIATSGFGAGLDAQGNAMVVWSQDETRVGRYSVWANRWTPSSGWGTASALESNSIIGGQDRDAIVRVAPNGEALVVWRQSANTSVNLWSTRYTPGSGWSGPGVIVPDAGIDQAIGEIDLAMDANGNALLAWGQNDFVGVGRETTVYTKRFSPGGWSGTSNRLAPVDLTTQGYLPAPRLAMNADGDAVVAWARESGEFSAAIAGAASGWASTQTVRSTRARRATSGPVAGIDAQRGAWLAWTDRSDLGGYEIAVNRNASATGWGGAATLYASPELQGAATIAVNENSDAVLAWVGVFAGEGTRVAVRYHRAAR